MEGKGRAKGGWGGRKSKREKVRKGKRHRKLKEIGNEWKCRKGQGATKVC